MILLLQRYYGDYNVTKSYLTVTDTTGTVLLRCEARELQYHDYANGDKIKGASYLCLPTGTYPLKITSDIGNPLCYQVRGATAHRSTKIAIDLSSTDDRRHDRILLGFSDTNPDHSARLLTDKEKCRDFLYRIILRQSQLCEPATLIVTNELMNP